MAKSKPLLPAQRAEINRMYLQLDDKDLATLVGSDPRTVKTFREGRGLNRNEYTKNKLGIKSKLDESKEMDLKGGKETI